MDVTQELRDTENALRDFVSSVLQRAVGPRWVETCGITEDRLAKWRERKAAERKRMEAGVVEERLIYYADFYDLKTVLNKNWHLFSPALGDWRTMEVYLTELERLRDPDAHRRELLPHQKHLVLGVSGEIRTRIVRYRSKQETTDDVFPRIESARDSLGNIWTPHSSHVGMTVITRAILRPGDMLDFVVTASDPLGERIEFAIERKNEWKQQWQERNAFQLSIREKDVGMDFSVDLSIRSERPYHAFVGYDDLVRFVYTVLPPRI